MGTYISRDYYAELRLCNDVMGIALGVWGNAGDCEVFRTMDRALDAVNLTELAYIKKAFDALSAGDRVKILFHAGTKENLPAIERLGEKIASLTETAPACTARSRESFRSPPTRRGGIIRADGEMGRGMCQRRPANG